MRGLAEKAEVSVQTVYNLFGSKGAVLHALRLGIVDKIQNQTEASASSGPLAHLLHMAEEGAKIYAADPQFLRTLMRALKTSNLGLHDSRLTSGSVKLFQRPIAVAIGAGLLRDDADAEFVARHLVIGFLGVLDLWVREVIDGEGLRTHLLYTFTLMLLGVSTDAGRAQLLKPYHQLQRELPRNIRETDTASLLVRGPIDAETKGRRKPRSNASVRYVGYASTK